MTSKALVVLSLFRLVAAYSFNIVAAPTQCGPLSLKINGTGKAPYTALVVPYGAFPGKTEQRKIFTQQFSGDSANFTLPYPSNSNFVVMVGDSDGIATGGTSIPTNVGSGSDSSCLPDSVSTAFSFQILPATAINQCVPATLAWNSSAQDPVSIYLVIPGGQSQAIPATNPGPQTGGTTGFSWTPSVRAGTNIILVANDKRGAGTGGSANTVVGFNPNNNLSCTNNDAPSSTPGPAAGAVETGSSGNSGHGGGGNDDNNGGSTTNVGAIVGGVVGGIAAALIGVLLVVFFLRRRRIRQHPAAHGVDLLPERAGAAAPDHPPEFYTPEPFIVPPHSHAGAEEDVGRPSMSEMGGRRYSALSTTDPSESGVGGLGVPSAGGSTSFGPSSSRKSPTGAPQLRPVNFVQHEDAGEVEEGGSGQVPETIELPPSYTSVRK